MSLQLVFQVCDPSANPVTDHAVAVLFDTNELIWFTNPSRIRLHLKVAVLSVAVKLKFIVEFDELKLLTGLSRDIVGAVLSDIVVLTEKFLVSEFP